MALKDGPVGTTLDPFMAMTSRGRGASRSYRRDVAGRAKVWWSFRRLPGAIIVQFRTGLSGATGIVLKMPLKMEI